MKSHIHSCFSIEGR